MEALIFNADFEWQLFQAKRRLQSTKKTQEFEHLICWVSPMETIFTEKEYSLDYKRWFFRHNQVEFKTTKAAISISNWLGNYDQIELKRKLQNKAITLQFAANYNLGPRNFSLIHTESEVEPGFLYKYPKSLSGMGHYRYEDKEKIFNLINAREVMTKEKLLNRIKDFSSLWIDGDLKFFYQNIVNDRFQYRGTIIDKAESFLSSHQKDAFEAQIPLLKSWIDTYQGVLSLDSFIYKENNQEQIYYLSEVNCRKTMGYIAWKLSQKFFPDKALVKFKFGRTGYTLKDYEKFYTISDQKIMGLSPVENKFQVFLIGADSESELVDLERIIF